VLVLAWQWWLGTTGPIQTAVAWAPFRVVFEHTPRSLPKLALKLVLSIAFPLIVTLTHLRAAARDRPLKLAWLTFAFGALYTYFLAELGPRLRDGNFLWSGQVTCLILVASSMAFLLRQVDWPSRAGRLRA